MSVSGGDLHCGEMVEDRLPEGFSTRMRDYVFRELCN